jgi:hypothetical protein
MDSTSSTKAIRLFGPAMYVTVYLRPSHRFHSTRLLVAPLRPTHSGAPYSPPGQSSSRQGKRSSVSSLVAAARLGAEERMNPPPFRGRLGQFSRSRPDHDLHVPLVSRSMDTSHGSLNVIVADGTLQSYRPPQFASFISLDCS